MIDFSLIVALLAESRVRDVTLGLREEAARGLLQPHLWLLTIPPGAIAIGWAISRITNRPPPTVNAPEPMFVELKRAHRINKAGRKLLQRIAEAAELAQPATMLLGSAPFDQAVERASHRLRLGRRQQDTLAQVRRQLFSG